MAWCASGDALSAATCVPAPLLPQCVMLGSISLPLLRCEVVAVDQESDVCPLHQKGKVGWKHVLAVTMAKCSAPGIGAHIVAVFAPLCLLYACTLLIAFALLQR